VEQENLMEFNLTSLKRQVSVSSSQLSAPATQFKLLNVTGVSVVQFLINGRFIERPRLESSLRTSKLDYFCRFALIENYLCGRNACHIAL